MRVPDAGPRGTLPRVPGPASGSLQGRNPRQAAQLRCCDRYGLSAITGKPYRLLSEAEYEYAARAGTTTVYPSGAAIGAGNANCAGCGSPWDGKQPAPAGSFSANAFGLSDMIGNVWEWTADCAHADYTSAPNDGSAWIDTNGCLSCVARGGSWNTVPAALRAANRLLITEDSLYFNLGVRVARTLVGP